MPLTRREFLRTSAALTAGVVTAPFAAAQATSVRGIDISHWQGTINWTSVRNSGIQFAFCKATEGTNYTDPTFATNWPAMRAAGIIRGAYHYGRPAADPAQQARRFYDTVRPQRGDLQLVLDLEADDGLTPGQVGLWAKKFCVELKRLCGRPGIIYTGFYFWRDEAGNSPNNYDFPLWLAAYVSNPSSLIPQAWSTWTFWQWTSSGSTPGISGNVDQDYFNGTLSQLNAFRLPKQGDTR